MKHAGRGRRGIALLVVITLMVLLFVVVVSMGLTSVQNLSDVARSVYQKQAYYSAAAGLTAAMAELESTPTWSAGFSSQALPNHSDNTYSVAVTNNFTGSAAVTASDGTSVPAGAAYLISTGATSEGGSRTVSAMVTRGGLFENPVFVATTASLSGNSLIDAWNSSQGAYSKSLELHSGVSVVTNSTDPNAVTLSGSADVVANMVVGPNGSPPTVIDKSGSAGYTGSAYAESQLQQMQTVTPTLSGTGSAVSLSHSSTTLSPGVYSSLTASSNSTVTLTGGTYLFTGNVSLSGGAKIAIDSTNGPVVVYLEGNWDSSGGSISNSGGKASNFQVYATSTTTSVKLTGGSATYVAFYAPSASVSLSGNGAVYGSVVANSITMSGNSQVHYDTQLKSVGAGGTPTITSYHRW